MSVAVPHSDRRRNRCAPVAALAAAGGWLSVAFLLVAGLVMGGCQKALFSPDEERSPYDRYDAIRAQRPPAYIEDEFGWKKPNVRGRLLDND